MKRQPSPNEQAPEGEIVGRLNELLRVVRQRQQNYFKVVEFIKRNIDTLGRQMEQLTIVHKFISSVDAAQCQLVEQEQVLIDQPSSPAPHCRKLVGRMAVRLFELFEVSLNRIRGTFFCSQRHQNEYSSFRLQLNKTMGSESMLFSVVAAAVLSYSRSKFTVELDKLKRFLYKIEHGADIDMKRYYLGNDEYDSDRSPDKTDREMGLRKKNSDSRKQSKESRQKKDQNKVSRSSEKEESPMAGRTATVSKIMKLYNVLDPSRTQFLQDMVYSESEEAHRSRLLSSLWEKNKAIDEQIRQYHKKVEFVADKIRDLKIPQPKSDCEGSDHNSAERSRSNMFRSEASIKTNNFIISKHKKDVSILRKSRRDLLEDAVGQQTDFVINSAGEYSSGAEYASDTGGMTVPHTDRTPLKQESTRRPVSKALLKRKGFPNLSSRPSSRDGLKVTPMESEPTKQMKTKSSSKNNRIFIVKSPTLFQDQTLQSRMVIAGGHTGTILNKKQSQVNASKLHHRPSNRRMSRSVLVKQQRTTDKSERMQKPPTQRAQPQLRQPPQPPISIFNQPPLLQDHIIFDAERVRQFGARKQFNLRLKKHMKKNILVSDRLFIEQTNEQINSYNF